jgi:hypothetical protein
LCLQMTCINSKAPQSLQPMNPVALGLGVPAPTGPFGWPTDPETMQRQYMQQMQQAQQWMAMMQQQQQAEGDKKDSDSNEKKDSETKDGEAKEGASEESNAAMIAWQQQQQYYAAMMAWQQQQHMAAQGLSQQPPAETTTDTQNADSAATVVDEGEGESNAKDAEGAAAAGGVRKSKRGKRDKNFSSVAAI